MMTLEAPAAADQHAVFAVTESGKRVRLTTPTTNWGQAQDEWRVFDDPRLYQGRVTLVNDEQVRWFAVRSMDDPEWTSAPEAHAQTIDLAPYHFEGKARGPLKAVREYAATQGIRGTEGGWLRREDGSTVTQGWASYIHMNLKSLRKDTKAREAALAHHFGIKG